MVFRRLLPKPPSWCCLLLLSSSTTYHFSPGWRGRVGDPAGAATPGFDDKAGRSGALPHAWNENEAFAKDSKELSTGVAWCRKHFRQPAGAASQRALAEFEGVGLAGESYLNGHALGCHKNGVVAQGYDPNVLRGFSQGQTTRAVAAGPSFKQLWMQ